MKRSDEAYADVGRLVVESLGLSTEIGNIWTSSGPVNYLGLGRLVCDISQSVGFKLTSPDGSSVSDGQAKAQSNLTLVSVEHLRSQAVYVDGIFRAGKQDARLSFQDIVSAADGESCNLSEFTVTRLPLGGWPVNLADLDQYKAEKVLFHFETTYNGTFEVAECGKSLYLYLVDATKNSRRRILILNSDGVHVDRVEGSTD